MIPRVPAAPFWEGCGPSQPQRRNQTDRCGREGPRPSDPSMVLDEKEDLS